MQKHFATYYGKPVAAHQVTSAVTHLLPQSNLSYINMKSSLFCTCTSRCPPPPLPPRHEPPPLAQLQADRPGGGGGGGDVSGATDGQTDGQF